MSRHEDQSAGREPPTGSAGGGPMAEAVGRLGATEPAELADELGVTPEECLWRLVEERGGRLAPEELIDIVPWSPATVSRLLSTLEDDDRIVRIHAGRGKMVFLSEQDGDGGRR